MPFDIKKFKEWSEEITQLDPPRWIIEDFLQADSIVQVSGEAKRAKKTWLALACAVAAAAGRTVAGLRCTQPHNVLIIEHEDAAYTFHLRFKMLEAGLGVNMNELPIWIMHRQHFYLESETSLLELKAFIEANQIKLVVLDTFVKSVQGDENDATTMTAALRQMDRLRVSGATIMYLHHLNKPPTYSPRSGPVVRDIDHEVRGSSALSGNYDQHFALRVWRPPPKTSNDPFSNEVEEQEEILTLIIRSKSVEEQEFIVDWEIEDNKYAKLKLKRRS